MDVFYKAIEEKRKIVIWGCGNYLDAILNRISPNLPIAFFCDTDESKCGKVIEYANQKYGCRLPEDVCKETDVFVLVAVRLESVYKAISEQLSKWKIEHIHIDVAIKDNQEIWEKEEIRKYDNKMKNVEEPADLDVLKRYVSISVPVKACNLKCEYCYIGQYGGPKERHVTYPTADFIRRALSRKRLNGTALLNICGEGETLLCNELADIIKALLEEGHYIIIVTNALLTSKIKELLAVDEDQRARLFFKCSFHYKQLKDKNLLDRFVDNVHLIRDSGASFMVELVPHDEIVSCIEEIKEFSVINFGALPHVTVARDESKPGVPILTSKTEREYRRIWEQFDSQLFEIKMDSRMKQTEYCLAGKGTFILDLDTGNVSQCPRNEMFANIYKNIDEEINYKVVGSNCKSEYCWLAHVYWTLGMVSKINRGSYLDVRNRKTINGENWVQPKMADFISQRICDNDI